MLEEGEQVSPDSNEKDQNVEPPKVEQPHEAELPTSQSQPAVTSTENETDKIQAVEGELENLDGADIDVHQYYKENDIGVLYHVVIGRTKEDSSVKPEYKELSPEQLALLNEYLDEKIRKADEDLQKDPDRLEKMKHGNRLGKVWLGLKDLYDPTGADAYRKYRGIFDFHQGLSFVKEDLAKGRVDTLKKMAKTNYLVYAGETGEIDPSSFAYMKEHNVDPKIIEINKRIHQYRLGKKEGFGQVLKVLGVDTDKIDEEYKKQEEERKDRSGPSSSGGTPSFGGGSAFTGWISSI